ncbi:MAG TPA: cytochrome c3 family protein [Candidatus Methylomirabilis sp.]|nr:cytochrome c3 family protein [Candidatus Methylomirabilis sp.]
MARPWAACLLVCAVFLGARAAHGAIADTVHNLSATGPGAVRATAVGELCIFCHTPHSAVQTRALWNLASAGTTYNVYASSTLEAKLNQPTGASRLCLSCHDGTLALGNLRVPPRTGQVTIAPLTGRASLGTDLSDDHPVSFVYDAALALKQGQLADPTALPRTIRLDNTAQLQCTACHEPHDSRFREFLRMDDRSGALCTACHRQRNWPGSIHATSPATWAGTGTNPWPDSPYTSVTENACENCHRPHSASHPSRLIRSAQERAVCLVCHAGTVAAKNLEPEFLKASGHPIASTDWTHEPREDPNTMPRHVTCVDCHNPHQATSTSANPPVESGRLRGARGLSISGSALVEATYEYEVCLKCHGVRDQATPGPVRQDNTRNIRLQVNPSNPSYHPVAAAGRNPTIQGLEPGYTASSLIYCTDCHNNDEWTPAGTRPKGPHGSRFQPILEREFQQGDPSAESFQSYALCYKCHNRTTLLGNGRFPHSRHVVDQQASCSTCHDAHGSRQNAHLINFLLRDRTGKVVVGQNSRGLIQYVSTGPGQGNCSLSCHGKDHDRQSY